MKIRQPRVSVGLPVYNGALYIREAIESILAQTFTDFELIISDNASTDSTPEICQEYAAQERRIRYFRNSYNVGVSENFNRVFALSTEEYFKWASHDDVCLPDYLERCVEVLENQPSVVLCYSKTRIIDEYGKFLENYTHKLDIESPKPNERFKSLISVRHPCQQIFGVIRRTALKATSLHGKYVGSDRNLVAELGLLGQFYEIPEYLFSLRRHPHSSVAVWPSERKRMIYFEPTFDIAKAKQLCFPTWRRGLEYYKSVQRSPLKASEKMLCYAQVVWWLRKRRRKLVREAKDKFLATVHPRFFSKDTILKRY